MNKTYAQLTDRKIERTIIGGEGTTTANMPLGDMYFFNDVNAV